MTSNATQKENYYNSESEGKEFKDAFYSPEEYGTWQTQSKETDSYIKATCEETFGKECYDEEFWQDYNNNTAEKKNNKHSDKSKAISRRLKEIYKERNKIYDQEET